MKKITGKKIIPLRYDTWNTFSVDNRYYFRVLPNYLLQQITGEIEQYVKTALALRNCPVCSIALTLIKSGDVYNSSYLTRYYNHVCTDCGFWTHILIDSTVAPIYVVPNIKRFDYENETPSILYLSNEIHKNKDKIFSMNASKFEKFVGAILSDFFDCEVHHIGQTGDDGIDLIAIVKDNPLAIQIKRRESPDKTEGIDVVKLLFASAFARGFNSGMVVSSAKRFTRPAKDWIESPKLNDIGFKLDLIDFNNFMSMIDAVRSKNSLSPLEFYMKQQKARGNSRITDDPNNIYNWKVFNLPDGDLVFRSHEKGYQLVGFEHTDLSKCYISVIDFDFRQRISKETCSIEFKSIVQETSEIKFFYDEEAVDIAAKLPFESTDQLVARWRNLFPNEIFNNDND